jgi:hypothetical protein
MALRAVDGTRLCSRCGAPATSSRHHYCDRCREARKRHKQRQREVRRRREVQLSRAERGYGPGHKRLRRRLVPIVEAGGVCCARCGEVIEPGEKWDLGHDDFDRSVYSGPEHQRCNRGDGGAHKQARARASRAW